MRKRFKRRGRKMFRRRRAKKGSYGGVIKFSTRFKGGKGSAMVSQVPFPQIYFTRHPYFQTFNTTTATQFFLRTFIVNDMFDIDGVGGDVGYAAAMEDIYREYVVLGCKYEVTTVNLEVDTSINVGIVFWPSNQPPSDMSELQYRAGSQTIMLGARDSGKQQQTLRGYANLGQLFGAKPAVEEDFWGTLSASPVRGLRCYIATSSNDSTAVYNIQTRVHFTLYVKWFNRNVIGLPSDAALGVAPTIGAEIQKVKNRLAILTEHLAKRDVDVELAEL